MGGVKAFWKFFKKNINFCTDGHPLLWLMGCLLLNARCSMLNDDDAYHCGLCTGCWTASEEIGTRVSPVTPLHLFEQDRGQKEMFCQCHWNTISEQKEIQLFCCGQRRPLRQKTTTSALPRWMQWPVFSTSNMSIGPRFKILQIDHDWGRRIMAC